MADGAALGCARSADAGRQIPHKLRRARRLSTWVDAGIDEIVLTTVEHTIGPRRAGRVRVACLELGCAASIRVEEWLGATAARVVASGSHSTRPGSALPSRTCRGRRARAACA